MLPTNLNPAKRTNEERSGLYFWMRALTLLTVVIVLTAGLFSIQNRAIIESVKGAINRQLKNDPRICNDALESSGNPSSSSSTSYIMRDFPNVEDLSASSDTSWNAMFNTPQGGFLWVKHNESMNLAWGVSMFHAIHCLTLLREHVQMSQGQKNDTAGHYNDHQLPGHSAFDSTHIGHCFSYIAQVILCAADDTIEPPWVTKDANGDIIDAGVDGMGYSHQCRDSSLTWNSIMRTEKEPMDPWAWRSGDTVRKVFENK